MKVAILSALHSFDDAYSVTRVMRDQVSQLEAAGHDVTWYVKQGFETKWGSHPSISPLTLPGYMHGKADVVKAEFIERFKDELQPYDAVLCHDLWFAPMLGWEGYREGIREVAPTTKAKWFHWTHSTPHCGLKGNPRSVPGHIFVALNHDAIEATKKAYSTENVEVLWNPSDVTDMLSPEARVIVHKTNLLDCDVLGVLPFPIGRLESKGISKAMEIYGAIAKLRRVHVLLCGGRADQVSKARMKTIGGATFAPGRWMPYWTEAFNKLGVKHWWAHELNPSWTDRVPNSVIRELMPLSNLFIWPTKGEACSLAIAEARTSGGPLVVLPEKGVHGMNEFSDEDCVLVDLLGWERFVESAILFRMERFERRLRRQYQWTRKGLWESQVKPMLERRCPGTW